MASTTAIAVLPFENPSGDPEQGYVARGFVEELVTELARFPSIEVIHPDRAEPASVQAGAYQLRGKRAPPRRPGADRRPAAPGFRRAAGLGRALRCACRRSARRPGRDRGPGGERAAHGDRCHSSPRCAAKTALEPGRATTAGSGGWTTSGAGRWRTTSGRGPSSSARSRWIRSRRGPTPDSPCRTSTSGAASSGSAGTRRSGWPSSTPAAPRPSTTATRWSRSSSGESCSTAAGTTRGRGTSTGPSS